MDGTKNFDFDTRYLIFMHINLYVDRIVNNIYADTLNVSEIILEDR